MIIPPDARRDRMTPAERIAAQDQIAKIYLSRHIKTGGTRRSDLASVPLTTAMVQQRRCFKETR